MKTIFSVLAIFLIICQVSKAQTNCDDLKKENEYLKKSLQINTPTKTVTTDKIDFNLIKCEGNTKDQTVNLILTLVNHAANRRILFDPAKAIDIEGNEYRSDRISLGTQDNSNDLYTDVPLKTVIRLSKVLPAAKILKIVPLKFFDPSSGHFEVELKDLTISWK
ncbi:hypothetical protein [Chitinophaga niabensis]|uniref:DUF4352 domain-containing protein n=1 Tax=Chitinophaga niabensis TaxID=536979 RepID=A0A1N6IWS1_9BACT|nr:hypothetical protein [Chitinophaga niabensis]SIO36490.1 hypothetical protein SAMN04488055_3418 [Chitinophaga niabensis]